MPASPRGTLASGLTGQGRLDRQPALGAFPGGRQFQAVGRLLVALYARP